MIEPVFVDFEASSLSDQSWPIEVGLAWLDGRKATVESKLIRPRSEWPEDDWSARSAAVHGISRHELDFADAADDVAQWFLDMVAGRQVVSDAPTYDQHWLNRLIGDMPSVKIHGFSEAAWQAFSQNGDINPGQLHRVLKSKAGRKTEHRAGPDARNLCLSWRAGIGKRTIETRVCDDDRSDL